MLHPLLQVFPNELLKYDNLRFDRVGAISLPES